MPVSDRLLAQAARATARQLSEAGGDLREARMALGRSQHVVAAAAGIPRNRYGRIENGRCPTLTVAELNRLAFVLGQRPAVRLFPGGPPVRDAAHSGRLQRFLSNVTPPLRYRLEAALPSVQGRLELRAWDAVLFGGGERTVIELEMRLRDVQAVRRRHDLKRRDDPAEHFLLLIADTRHNRRVVAEFEDLFAGLPRLRATTARGALRAGRHPGTGLLFV